MVAAAAAAAADWVVAIFSFNKKVEGLRKVGPARSRWPKDNSGNPDISMVSSRTGLIQVEEL